MVDSRTAYMAKRLIRTFAAAFAAVALLAPPVAHGFTFEDGNKGSTSIPKFDLEEQAKQFRTPQLDASSTAKREFDTPLGKLQFGVQERNSMFGYGSPLSSGFGASSGNSDRRHLDRMFTPEYLQGGPRGN